MQKTIHNKIATKLLKDKKIKNSFFAILLSIARWALIIGVGYIILFPLFNMVSTSLKSADQILDPGVVWIPRSISLDNFKDAWMALDYPKTLLNTLKTNILSALIEVVMCAFAAYGFSRFKFKGKNLMIAFLFITMIIPPQLTVISSYVQFKNFDILSIIKTINQIFGTEIEISLINTPWTFILPSLFGVGLKSGIIIYIYMQFFKALPKELEEAAYVDGATPLRTFLTIIMPSSSVIVITVLVFSVVWHWNEHFLSVIYFSSNFTLAPILSDLENLLIINGFRSEGAVLGGVIMASCLLFILPVLIFYLIIQKRFIQCVTTSGIVG